MAAIENDPTFRDGSVATEPLTPEDLTAKEEIKHLFQFIGAYVVVFQDIEAKLDQIIQLAVGLDRGHVSHGVVAQLSNNQKIDLINSIVHSSAISSGTDFQKEWVKSFDEVIQRLKTEGIRRNKIVHSLYIFDFMQVGSAALRSKRKRARGERELDQEWIDAAYISRATGEIYELSFDIGMALTQLRPWSELLESRAAKEG